MRTIRFSVEAIFQSAWFSITHCHTSRKKKRIRCKPSDGFIVAQKRSAKYSSREVRKIKDHRGCLLISSVWYFFKTLSLCLFALAACNHPGHQRVSHPFVHISNTSRRRLFDPDFSANHGRRDRHLVMLMRDEGGLCQGSRGRCVYRTVFFPSSSQRLSVGGVTVGTEGLSAVLWEVLHVPLVPAVVFLRD